MASSDPLLDILKEYVELDEKVAAKLCADLERGTNAIIVSKSQKSILKKIELHTAANDAIEEEVSKFREELYSLCKAIASRDMEKNIITESHVNRARHQVWRGVNRVNLTDGFLALGSVLVGTAIPHFVDLFSKNQGVTPNSWLLVFGVIGGLLLGAGIHGKSRPN